MYGQTEASPRISYIEYPKNKKKLGSIGKPYLEANFLLKKELIYKGKIFFVAILKIIKIYQKLKIINIFNW